MKYTLLCLFAILFLLSITPAAQAGFIIKKHTLVAAAANHTEIKSAKAFHMFSRRTVSHPYYPFAYGGWVGIVAIICGICGFFYGGFAIAAILFGFWGMGRRHKNKGLAIVGLVLGIVAIVAAVAGTFSGFPIF